MSQDPLHSLLTQAVAHHQSNRLGQAEHLYRQILSKNPDHPDALHLFGLLCKQANRPDIALPLIKRTAILNPDEPIYHNSLGAVLLDLHRLNDAVAAYGRALELKPDYPDAIVNLGAALAALGRHDDAIVYFRRALDIDPKHDLALTHLGNALDALNRLDEALAAHRKAIALSPQNADAHNNAAMALTQLGRSEEAIPLFRRTIALRPDWPIPHSNLLLALHYAHGHDGPLLSAEHRAFAGRFERPIPRIANHSNDRSPTRRLRIAYVSPDLYRHPVSDFLLPLISNHDKAQFEVLIYSDTRRPDATTAQLKSHADRWLDTAHLTDEQLAARIVEDRVDLLIDLAGHTNNNRLLVFARRPAPVQFTWMGYPNTTGLSSIDYRLTDSITDPASSPSPGTPGEGRGEGNADRAQGPSDSHPATDALHTERLIRLDPCFLCYRPPADAPPLQRSPRNHITFGSFNNFAKITDAMLATWATLFNRVPHSRLILKARALATPSARDRVVKVMAAHGIAEDRLTLLSQTPSHANHLSLYADIDIALDTHPYNGTTTTCEALWMGVPVVTLAGPTHVTRVSASLLTAAGHSDWIARSEPDYLEIAIRLAQNLPDRPSVRASVANSPLRYEIAFARRVESALRQTWLAWLNSP